MKTAAQKYSESNAEAILAYFHVGKFLPRETLVASQGLQAADCSTSSCAHEPLGSVLIWVRRLVYFCAIFAVIGCWSAIIPFPNNSRRLNFRPEKAETFSQAEFIQFNPQLGPFFFNHQIALVFHQIGLELYGSEGSQGQPASYSSEERQHPVWNVCRGVQFAPWILGRLFGALFLFVCAALCFDCNNWLGRIGGFLLFLGIFLLLAPVPWDLGPCPVEAPQQQSEVTQ